MIRLRKIDNELMSNRVNLHLGDSKEVLKKLQLTQGRKSWSKHLQDQLRLNKNQLLLIKSYCTKDEFINAENIWLATIPRRSGEISIKCTISILFTC